MKIYMTRYNSDMTEGRGPMITDKVFLNLEDAANYIDNKPGVMGRRAKWSEQNYGDWEIVEMFMYESAYDENEDKRQKALAKLSAEERQLLGL